MCIFLGEQDNGLSRYVSHHVMTLSLSLSLYTLQAAWVRAIVFLFFVAQLRKRLFMIFECIDWALCCSNLLDVCVCVSFLLRLWSNASAKEKRTWTWCPAQSVLIRSVIQTAVGRSDRIHHWVQNFFLFFFSFYSFHSFNVQESE